MREEFNKEFEVKEQWLELGRRLVCWVCCEVVLCVSGGDCVVESKEHSTGDELLMRRWVLAYR